MEPKGSFQLKGKLFTLTVLQIFNHDLACLEQELKQHVEMAPGFFNHTPIVIDLNEMENLGSGFDFERLKSIICSSSLIPVGVKGADKGLQTQIENAGLAILADTASSSGDNIDNDVKNSATTIDKTEEQQTDTDNQAPFAINEEPSATTNEEPSATTIIETQTVEVAQRSMLVKQAIRSGRQIYAPHGDLIIIGSVSAGAEVLADGNIHIYGTLRGRALAGIKGNTEAAIFCHNLQAELVSIAGIYKLSDDMPNEHIGNFSQVTLVDEKLQFHHLN